MGFDLVWFFRNFDPKSPHHIAAVNDLATVIPSEHLDAKADWVNTYMTAEQERVKDSKVI